MLELILTGLVPLGIAMLCNIGLGIYCSIGIDALEFDRKKLLNGVLKAIIIGNTFVGMAYCFGETGLGGDLVTPREIISAATILYMGKSINNLMNIFGIKLTKAPAPISGK